MEATVQIVANRQDLMCIQSGMEITVELLPLNLEDVKNIRKGMFAITIPMSWITREGSYPGNTSIRVKKQ